MTGVLKVIDMLGATIAALEAELDAERAETARLCNMLDALRPPDQAADGGE